MKWAFVFIGSLAVLWLGQRIVCAFFTGKIELNGRILDWEMDSAFFVIALGAHIVLIYGFTAGIYKLLGQK
jgi:hypothetical protein